MTPAEEIRRLDARLERITAAAEPVREWVGEFADWGEGEMFINSNELQDLKILLAAIDGKPELASVTTRSKFSAEAKSGWRVGHKVPINVYDGNRPVCQCHTEEDARRIVAAMNAIDGTPAQPRDAETQKRFERGLAKWQEKIQPLIDETRAAEHLTAEDFSKRVGGGKPEEGR